MEGGGKREKRRAAKSRSSEAARAVRPREKHLDRAVISYKIQTTEQTDLASPLHFLAPTPALSLALWILLSIFLLLGTYLCIFTPILHTPIFYLNGEQIHLAPTSLSAWTQACPEGMQEGALPSVEG